MVSTIKALDPSVVNKIAAGEIIISPVNALKEMLENSIDAGSTTIDILVKEGGIKLLQITDNGSGINKDDLPILCQRFTTSKLTTFEDLDEINTYGFRGEALASISHIARLTVTTKTEQDKCAWKVSFAEGKMCGNPTPIAGKTGTTILVEDLFYNMPSRLRSLRSPNDEYNKILDVIGKYSIHSQNIGMSCKKFGDSQYSLTIKSTLDMKDRIRTVFDNSIASNLLHFNINKDDIEDNLSLQNVSAYVSNLNYLSKKSVSPIFFINNRLVTCDPLRRALNQPYSNFLPKGNRPFIYLSLSIDPKSVDVNVHPTKREVRFLHQDEIIEQISIKLHDELSNIDTSRTFKASTILTGSQSIGSSVGINTRSRISNPQQTKIDSSQNHRPSVSKKSKNHENKMVRIDASQARITSFLQSSQYVQTKPAEKTKINDIDGTSINDSTTLGEDNIGRITAEPVKIQTNDDLDRNVSQAQNNIISESTNDHDQFIQSNNFELPVRNEKLSYTIIKNQRTMVNLSSIKDLRDSVDQLAHKELTDIFANLNYVGIIDEERRLVAIQHDLKLFLVDYGAICSELFYQICLTDFANFGRINLLTQNNNELKLMNLLSIFDDLDPTRVGTIIKKMWDMREMLLEYFSVELRSLNGTDDLDAIQLVSIPLLLKGYNPPLSKLAFFIRRIGTNINWEDEKECLDGILRQISLLYIPPIIKKIDTNDETVPEDIRVKYVSDSDEMAKILENVIFPCVKRRLLATKNLLKDVVEIANLPGLYKVFERC